jgi:hypothetical protein
MGDLFGVSLRLTAEASSHVDIGGKSTSDTSNCLEIVMALEARWKRLRANFAGSLGRISSRVDGAPCFVNLYPEAVR